MTVSLQTPYSLAVGNGVTTQFFYTFRILASTDLTVYVDGVLKTLNVDYTVAGVGGANGGSITFLTGAPAATLKVKLIRAMRRERLTDYQQHGDFNSPVVNPDFDRAVMLIQDVSANLDRAVTIPPDELGTPMVLPSLDDRMSKVFTFDEQGEPAGLDPQDIATVAAFVDQTSSTFTGDGVTTAFTLSKAPGVAANCQVYVDGLRFMSGLDFTISGTTLTFTLAPHLNAQILVTYGATLPQFDPGELNVRSLGALGDGVNNDAPTFTSMFAASAGLQCVPAGNWRFNSNVSVPIRNLSVRIDPTATYSGAGLLKFDDIVPFQHDPTFVHNFHRKTYDSSWNAYWGTFLLGALVEATGTTRAVGLLGQGLAAANGSRAWGANLIGSATADGGIAIGCEIDAQVIGPTNTAALAYGLVIAASGDLPVQNAIQIQADHVESPFVNGIVFDMDPGEGNVTQALFKCAPSGAVTMQRFLYVSSNASASLAELDLPSFAVSATQANTVNRLSARGAATGSSPRISATGNDANLDVGIFGKGTGGGSLTDGASAIKFRWSTSGIAFFGTAITAQKSLAAATGTATRTTFDTTTVTLQQLAERVKAIIDDTRAYGLHA